MLLSFFDPGPWTIEELHFTDNQCSWALIQKLIVSGILHKMIVPGIWFIMRPLNVYQQLEHKVMKSPLLELGSHVSLHDANDEINPIVLYIDVGSYVT